MRFFAQVSHPGVLKKKLFTLFVLVSFASILAQTPEWSFDKAERLSSLTREQVCINGLWQFRSEPSLKPNEKTKIFYQDDIEENTIKNWIITNVPGIEFIPSADTSKKTTGDASLTRLQRRQQPTSTTACTTSQPTDRTKLTLEIMQWRISQNILYVKSKMRKDSHSA